MSCDDRKKRWHQVSIRTLGLLTMFFASVFAFQRAANEKANNAKRLLEKQIAALNEELDELYALKRTLPLDEPQGTFRTLKYIPPTLGNRRFAALVRNTDLAIARSNNSLAAAQLQLKNLSKDSPE